MVNYTGRYAKSIPLLKNIRIYKWKFRGGFNANVKSWFARVKKDSSKKGLIVAISIRLKFPKWHLAFFVVTDFQLFISFMFTFWAHMSLLDAPNQPLAFFIVTDLQLFLSFMFTFWAHMLLPNAVWFNVHYSRVSIKIAKYSCRFLLRGLGCQLVLLLRRAPVNRHDSTGILQPLFLIPIFW